MKTWVRKTLSAGILAAGALLLAPAAAQADVHQNTSGNVGVANGTQVFTTVAVPLNVVGNSIGVAGESNSAGQGINWVESGTGGKQHQSSSGNTGVLNGTQVLLPVTVPVNVAGNAVSVLGEANAAGAGVNQTESARTETGSAAGQNSSGNTGVLNGTQVGAPIDVPVNVCGNSLAVLGLANSQAVCVNGGGSQTESVEQNTSDNTGIGNGTQIAAPVYVPLNITGNSASVLGEANAAGASANESGHQGGGSRQDSGDNTGVLNGTQVAAPITVPVNVCGNALAVLGEANASAACANGTGNGGDNDGDEVDGDGGSQDGDDSYGEHPRKSQQAANKTEATPADGLTQNLSNAGGLNVGGLDVAGLLK